MAEQQRIQKLEKQLKQLLSDNQLLKKIVGLFKKWGRKKWGRIYFMPLCAAEHRRYDCNSASVYLTVGTKLSGTILDVEIKLNTCL